MVGHIYISPLSIWHSSDTTDVREIRRISCLNFSHVLEQVNETLSGLAVIRGLVNQHNYFKGMFYDYFDEYQRAAYSNLIVTLWFSFSLKLIAFLLMAFIIYASFLKFVLTRTMNSGCLNGLQLQGNLASSWLMGSHAVLMGLIQMLSETEREMVSVERTSEYTNLPSEVAGQIVNPIDDWKASSGSLQFVNVSFSYDNGHSFPLQNISFSMSAGDKIGIVGRTGVGKSTIFAALFRLVDVWSGSVFYDNTDISQLSLHSLRKNLTIVSQDPLVFDCSVRENLLCTSTPHHDDLLWDVLKKCHLTGIVRTVGGLDGHLAASQLSFGEKQLFSIARAFFSDAKIICFDEITAAVDPETEEQLIESLDELLKGRSALIITHRLNLLRICTRTFVLGESSFTEQVI